MPASYFGEKQPWQKELIQQQVADIAHNYFKRGRVELDNDCHWVMFHEFNLPDAWRQANPGRNFVPMLLIFPDQYPHLPPNGFFLPNSLRNPYSDSFYRGSYQDEERPAQSSGWEWYASYEALRDWSPAGDVIRAILEQLADPFE
ncbi:MAG: hypothetical protein FWH52_05645 [Synergistaceae bacterium]|nr:hypothetical protein [Synergistaceae bacterium]